MSELRSQTFNCYSNEGWKTVNEEGVGVWKRLPMIKDDDYLGMSIQCILYLIYDVIDDPIKSDFNICILSLICNSCSRSDIETDYNSV